jgi:hypothetical protein
MQKRLKASWKKKASLASAIACDIGKPSDKPFSCLAARHRSDDKIEMAARQVRP